MNDEEFEDLLRDAASTYNTPPAPPREVMWNAIATARSAAAVVPISRRVPRWLVSVAGAAAVLVIGIAIGRQSRDGAAPPREVASAWEQASIATIPHVATAAEQPSEDDSSSSSANTTIEGRAARRVAVNDRAVDAGRDRYAARRSASRAARASQGAQSGTGNESFNDVDAYRLAVVEHLTRTEVLLTGFRAEARSGDATKLDAHFAAVSRELLGTTRLLLATRRGEDPVITRLLQDLEFVLMQISQYANDGRGVDLDAINQSLDRRNVLPKLRNSIPAGVSSSAGT